jgi:hypothetical protein
MAGVFFIIPVQWRNVHQLTTHPATRIGHWTSWTWSGCGHHVSFAILRCERPEGEAKPQILCMALKWESFAHRAVSVSLLASKLWKVYNDDTKGMEAISENFENNMVAHKLRRNTSSGSLFVYNNKNLVTRLLYRSSDIPFLSPPPPQ